jgi:hypothetical protein
MYDALGLAELMDALSVLEREASELAARRVRVLAAIHGVEVSQWAAEAGAGGGRWVMSRWRVGIGIGCRRRSG